MRKTTMKKICSLPSFIEEWEFGGRCYRRDKEEDIDSTTRTLTPANVFQKSDKYHSKVIRTLLHPYFFFAVQDVVLSPWS